MSKFKIPEFTPEENWIIKETKRTGSLNLASNYFFQLPKFGTRWMEDDAIGHYRKLLVYEQVHDAWIRSGKPDDAIDLVVNDYPYRIVVDWVGDKVEFLLKHGFIFPKWIEGIVDQKTDIALVITGTGSGKTAGVAISSLLYCLMYPGFEYMNIAPSEKQAKLILAELDKWAAEGSPFNRFVRVTSRHKLYTEKPYALSTIVSPLDPRYPSHFACQTIGEHSADQILGESKDRFSIDECQLVGDLEAVIPKAVTRFRAQRPDGSNRWSSLLMLTNPPDDPSRAANIEMARKKIEDIQANPDQYGAHVSAVYMENVQSGENLYITRKQIATQRSMMDEVDQQRWIEGNTDLMDDNGEIPVKLITANIDPVMKDEINGQGLHETKKRQGMGLISYRMPWIEDHFYIVTGDPGKRNALKKSYNNVPVVTVFDVTGFPTEPIQMVAFSMIDGNGKYTNWLNRFKHLMMFYKAPGYYDATNLGITGAEDFGAFDGGQVELEDGSVINLSFNFPTTPITFANTNKRWAQSAFTMIAQDKMFAWPDIECLKYQASKFITSGKGVEKVADDILASIFVLAMAMRIDGLLWSKFKERYHIDYEQKHPEQPRDEYDDERQPSPGGRHRHVHRPRRMR